MFGKNVVNCIEMGQGKPTSQEEAKCLEEEREVEYQARQECKRRQATALAKLNADKEEQEKKKLTALSEKSNNDEDTHDNQETASEEFPLENSGSMKATSSSEPVESSKVNVVIPSSIKRCVHKCSVYPARMKMKLPLQQTNEMVEKLAAAGNKMSVQNDSNV